MIEALADLIALGAGLVAAGDRAALSPLWRATTAAIASRGGRRRRRRGRALPGGQARPAVRGRPRAPRGPRRPPPRPSPIWTRRCDEGPARLDRPARARGRARARRGPGRSPPRDHGDRRPRLEGPRPGAALRERDRQRAAGADQPVRQRPPHVPGARHREPRRPGTADRVAHGPAAAAGRGGQGEGARQAARAGLVLRQDRPRRPLPGDLAGRAGPGPAADPHLLARGRRPVRDPAAGVQPRPPRPARATAACTASRSSTAARR